MVNYTVATIVVSVAVPSSRNTTVVVRAAETVAGTRSLRTSRVVLIGIVTAVIVSIAQPKRFDANVGRITFEMTCRTGSVASATFTGLVRRVGVFTIVDSVTNLKQTICWINLSPSSH